MYYPNSGIGRGVPLKEFSRASSPGKYLATIDPATGRVTKVEIAQSCGSPALDASAQKQILQWKARPHGYTEVYVPITFHPR
jgi:TonB family protein